MAITLANFLSAQQKSHDISSKKPNFLFILVDDQPFDAIGYTKRYPFLSTPNMDRLYEEGAIINNFFVTQSICSPSRASFLTGTYPHIHGVNQNNRYVDPKWDEFAPYNTHLQNGGYQTAHVGKIHMAHFKGRDHIRPGFDYWFSFIGQGKYFDPFVNDNGEEYQVEGYMTDILTNKAIEWLKQFINLIYQLRGMKIFTRGLNSQLLHTIRIKKHLKENQNGKEKELLVSIGRNMSHCPKNFPNKIGLLTMIAICNC
jgi:hypothetical protein